MQTDGLQFHTATLELVLDHGDGFVLSASISGYLADFWLCQLKKKRNLNNNSYLIVLFFNHDLNCFGGGIYRLSAFWVP